jgi:hypothetical protein
MSGEHECSFSASEYLNDRTPSGVMLAPAPVGACPAVVRSRLDEENHTMTHATGGGKVADAPALQDEDSAPQRQLASALGEETAE